MILLSTIRLIHILLIGCACFIMGGCLTFRESPRKLNQFFSKHDTAGKVDYYNAAGRKMQFAEAGDETKPLVFFIHGSPGSLSAFVEYLVDSTLLKSCHMITADRPGFGYSGLGYAEPSLEKQGFILKTLIEQKKKNRPVILVGHSLGGPLAARMAIDYPDLINGVVIVAGSVDPELEPNEMWFRAPLATPFLSWILPKSFRASNDEIYQLKPQLEELVPQWHKVKCPVAVVHGTKDTFVPIGNADFISRQFTNASIDMMIHEGGNHFIPWTHPQLIREAVLKMLNKVSTPEASQIKEAKF